MRLLCVLVICIFASANSFAADLLPLTKDGFGGIKWGSEYSDKLGLECVDYGRHIVCTKDNESLKEIGGVAVDVNYVFYGVYFNSVYITFDDAHQWPITKALTKAYDHSDSVPNIINGFGYINFINGGSDTRTAILGEFIPDIKQVLTIWNSAYAYSVDPAAKDAATNRFDKMALSIFTGAERNKLEGFLGVKWGMMPKQIPHKLLAITDDDEEKRKYLQMGNFHFGSLPVDNIEYEFINDKLTAVNIYFKLHNNIYLLAVNRYAGSHMDKLQEPFDIFKNILELNFGKFIGFNNEYHLRLPETILSIQKDQNGGVHIEATTVNKEKFYDK